MVVMLVLMQLALLTEDNISMAKVTDQALAEVVKNERKEIIVLLNRISEETLLKLGFNETFEDPNTGSIEDKDKLSHIEKHKPTRKESENKRWILVIYVLLYFTGMCAFLDLAILIYLIIYYIRVFVMR